MRFPFIFANPERFLIGVVKLVNAEVDTMTELFKRLHRLGVIPQYLFHPRPVKHATHFQLTIIEAMHLVEAIRQRCNGSVKRFRYILTHSDGKLELVGLLEGSPMQLVVRWHQVRRDLDKSGLMVLEVDEDTVWLGEGN